jgi:hypothetical protein
MAGQDLTGAVAAAVARIARELGAEVVPPGCDPVQLLAPAAALRVARQVELAARAEVGGLLGFGPLAAGSGVSVADYAFDYTVGPSAAGPWFDPPVLAWTCPACGQLIRDRGPVLMPAADEAGHADGCARLAAVQADWLAAR